MKAAYYTGLHEVTIEDVPRPKRNRPENVLVEINRVGICGSDIHYYLDGGIGDQKLEYPATLGHECSGTVVEIGSAVEGLQPGDRVAIDPAMSCGQCDQCRAGRINTCRNIQFMGVPGEALGAVAEYRVVPGHNCLPIPENLSLDQAALSEPLSIGLYAVQLGRPHRGAGVAVLGSGPIGLSVLLCLKATAPCTVYVTDLIPQRLDVAEQCGADWTANAETEDVVAAVTEKEPCGLDVVFECSGDPEIIDQAQRLLTPGGTLVLVGIPPTPRVSFDSHYMRRNELVFKNVRRQKDCVQPVIRMISEGAIDPDPLLTHHFPLEEIRDAFELVAGYRDGVIKAVLDLSGAE